MRRALPALVAFLCGGLALVDFAAHGEAATSTPSAVATGGASSKGLLAEGRKLFVSSCSACHGLSAQGISGRAPSLHGVGALAADFYLETGRMPLPSSREQPMRTHPAFSQQKIAALTAYVASYGGPPIPTVNPKQGSLARGHSLFALDCAGCHTIQGQGGIVTGAIVPSLNPASPTQIGEAIRIGPYVMPRFGTGELSAADVNSIARYLQSTRSPDDAGGWGLGRIGPIPEGMVAWLLAGTALLAIARLLGERTQSGRDPQSGAPPSREARS